MDELEAFLGYAARFDENDNRVHLKIVHTLGVLGNIRAICAMEHIPANIAAAAEKTAVFHDVGRFEQLRRYNTFFDARSVDHAMLSADITEQMGWLDDDEFKGEIIEAIRRHNRLDDRPKDETAALLYDLVRDADKLDILRVFACDDVHDVTGSTEEEARKSMVSPAVKNDVLSGRCVDKRHRSSPIDIWMTYLGFLNDFHFESSKTICLKTGFWKKRIDEGEFADESVRELAAFLEKSIKSE